MASNDDTGRFTSLAAMVLATAGVAIGLGNIWRFPYMMAEYGGVAFLLVYLFIVVALGIPALMIEWALGRHTRSGPLGAFTGVKMPLGRLVTAVLLITVLLAASYYGVVLAWALALASSHLSAALSADLEPVKFSELTGQFGQQMNYVVITVFLGCGTLLFGVRGGIERLSTMALPLFFGLFVILIARSLTLPGAMDGLRRYLVPRADAFQPTTFLAAMGQAFFSLGLGGTFMVMYGSYMRREDAIPRAAFGTAVADVTAAVMAGLIVIPAVLALGVALDTGPALMFETMPQVFARMPAGNLFGALFFLSVFIVALLSLIAAYEVLVAAAMRGLAWTRRTALTIVFLAEVLLAMPAVLIPEYIGISDLIWGTTMQPLGSMLAIIALVWCLGRVGTFHALSRDARVPFGGFLIFWLKYIMPVAIIAIVLYGWLGG